MRISDWSSDVCSSDLGMLESGALKNLSGRIGLSQRVDRFAAWIYVNWKALTVIAWLGICAWFLVERWNAIYWLALNDTDDNIRFVQVKDWLAERKSGGEGKSGSVSVELGGGRII